MKSIKDDFKTNGYSQEEAYFYRMDQYLIRRMREKKAAEIKKKRAEKRAHNDYDEEYEHDFKKAA